MRCNPQLPFLSSEVFRTIVSNTPLVSIDLIVRNSEGCVLLGKRLNPPAQDYWFVPGGRIRKNESLANAYNRLCEEELGLESDISEAKYLGLYEHFYGDSIFEGIATHYVVSGFELIRDMADVKLPKEQHSTYVWMDEDSLMNSEKVHRHIKWYFRKDEGFL